MTVSVTREYVSQIQSAGHSRAQIFMTSPCPHVQNMQNRDFAESPPVHVQQNVHNLKLGPSVSRENLANFVKFIDLSY